MRKRIIPYIAGSASARDLSRATNILRLRAEGSRFRPRASDLIINWGYSRPLNMGAARVLNKPAAVQRASNKLSTFQALAPGEGVPWTIDKEVAVAWLAQRGTKVVCRTTLNGHSGHGIVIAGEHGELVDALLYTRYVPKKDEYRVHVWQGSILDYAAKKRRHEGVTNEYVRSFHNGWVFARGDVVLPDVVVDLAKRCIVALGLDFGAVDIVVDKHSGTPYVLEVNTAPGLVGTTLERYSDAINRL